MSDANKEVVRKIEEAWNANRLDELDQYFEPNFTQHNPFPGITPTLETAKQAHQASISAFPDRTTTIEEMIAEGDRVMVRMRVQGTNTGGLPFLNVPANGNKIDIEWISIYGLRNGKVYEHRALMDLTTFMQQLSAAPA
jgi:steroid delta-isomerase-like uncharacterized protein